MDVVKIAVKEPGDEARKASSLATRWFCLASAASSGDTLANIASGR
jgi:hypothetical protein